MRSSSIRRPQNNRYIQVYDWQVQFCQGNHCTAFVLGHFIAWHDWKLQHDDYYSRANNIAEQHGDGRPHNQNAYLFFSVDEISKGILGTYGKNSIINALQVLEKLGVISIHKNPNPRYHFDKTKYFIFNPEVCNAWIAKNYSDNGNEAVSLTQVIDNFDSLKLNDRSAEINPPSPEINSPSIKKGRAITYTTNNSTNNNRSINTCENFVHQNQNAKSSVDIQPIINSLIASGFPSKRFGHQDSMEDIQRLCRAGATVEIFSEAYRRATLAAGSCGFGLKYLAKVVERMLDKNPVCTSLNTAAPTSKKVRVFENNIPAGFDWIEGDDDYAN